jgi:hypothetical protein
MAFQCARGAYLYYDTYCLRIKHEHSAWPELDDSSDSDSLEAAWLEIGHRMSHQTNEQHFPKMTKGPLIHSLKPSGWLLVWTTVS